MLTYSRPYGVANAMERVIEMAREETEKSERDAVAAEIDVLVRESGLSRTEFASRIGTSASRLWMDDERDRIGKKAVAAFEVTGARILISAVTV